MIVLWSSASYKVLLILVDDAGVEYQYTWQADRMLARDMLAYLRDRLAGHGATFDDISGIGVHSGPGSFTGLRIGLTVLNTIAHTLKVPIVGVDGDGWRDVARRSLVNGVDEKIVMPMYGAPASVTLPRK